MVRFLLTNPPFSNMSRHLEGASGLLSLIKATMMLERGVMLPNANFEKLNPAILEASGADRLRVLKETMPWPESSPSPRRVCVTNYGKIETRTGD